MPCSRSSAGAVYVPRLYQPSTPCNLARLISHPHCRCGGSKVATDHRRQEDGGRQEDADQGGGGHERQRPSQEGPGQEGGSQGGTQGTNGGEACTLKCMPAWTLSVHVGLKPQTEGVRSLPRP